MDLNKLGYGMRKGHFVGVQPLEDDVHRMMTLKPYAKWLKENKIEHYSLPHDPWFAFGQTGFVPFRFEEPEDAVAFKLFWDGKTVEEE